MKAPLANQPIRLIYGGTQISSRVIRRMNRDLYIDAVLDHASMTPPRLGAIVEIRWADEDRLWGQSALVQEILDPLPILVLRLTESPTTLEQRTTPRLKVALPLEYCFLRAGSPISLTTTLDLSAKSLRFPCEQQLWRGLSLRLKLHIAGQVLEMTGVVSRVAPESTLIRGRYGWETVVEFYQIPLRFRNFILRYVEEGKASARGDAS